MELKLLDSKSILRSNTYSNQFLNYRNVAGFGLSPDFCSCRGISPKASFSGTSNGTYTPIRAINSLFDKEKLVAEDYFGQITEKNVDSTSPFARNLNVLEAYDDEYGGIVVDPDSLPSHPDVFASVLRRSVLLWKTKGKKGIWLKLPLERAELVPIAVKEGFEYHHAERGYVMMTYWIPDGPCMLPANASHQVGVGGFVVNDENEVLVVQEKFCAPSFMGLWKIPTGFINESEEIYTGAVREVKEETGVDTEFVEVIAFRHAHNVAFEKSDLFFICMLRPLSTRINVDEYEIQAAKWMPLAEFVEQPLIQGDGMFKKVMDICIARLGKKYCGLNAHQVVSKFDGRPSCLYYNIVDAQNSNCVAN